MVDITHKSSTLRIATAGAVVTVGHQATIEAIKKNAVPKGDVFEMSKAAGLLAIKNTPQALPDCHPIPIEYAGFEFEIEDLQIKLSCTVKTIYKTGVEVEAMHGVSVAALNMYDMLKPIDKQIEIGQIRLIEKKGGKSDFKNHFRKDLKAWVIVCSDTISAGHKEDKAGKVIIEVLEGNGIDVNNYEIIPDEKDQIQNRVNLAIEDGTHMIIFTGGTGLSARDVTPEALSELIERRIPGIEETIRNYGQQRTPFAMLSRSIVGTIGDSLVLGLPGSTKGAKESMQAIFPQITHLFGILKGAQH